MITVLGKPTSLSTLHNIPLIRPKDAGATWQGIQHGVLAGTIMDKMRERKWGFPNQKFSVSKDGTELAGAFDLRLPEMDAPNGTELALGFLHDNKRQRALRLYVGATVAVCSNGLATGEIILCRRHTTRFALGDAIEKALDEYILAAKRMNGIIESLKTKRLKQRQFEHLLLEAGRKGLMPWSRIGDVDREYRNPSHKEFEERTSWSLLNAYTQVVKRNPPRKQMDQINKFRELLPVANAG